MKKSAVFKFCLYVAGEGPNSTQAIANLREICREHLPERHEIEIVDVLIDQRRALTDKVMMTPLLAKFSPDPPNRIVGNLNQRKAVLQALGLVVEP